MNINCIIIEDEAPASDKLKGFIEQLDFLHLSAVFDNGVDAINYLRNNSVDLIFLDIQMKDLNGIQFLRKAMV